MDVIQDTVIKFLGYAILASLLPFVILLVGAAFNERVRRVALVLVILLTLLVAFMSIAVTTHDLADVHGWAGLQVILLDTAVRLYPALFVLAVLGGVGYFFGPGIARQIAREVQQNYRRAYLERVLERVEPQPLPFLALRQHAEILKPLSGSLLITGAPGLGKTLLVNRLAAELARAALQKSDGFLPILVDLDRLLLEGFTFENLAGLRLAGLQSVSVPLLEGILRGAVANKRACFLVDASAASFSIAGPEAVIVLLEQLQRYAGSSPVVAALPPDDHEAAFAQRFHASVELKPLEDREALDLFRLLAPGKEAAHEALFKADTHWRSLARNNYLLTQLAAFARQTGKLPADLRALFRQAVYPARLRPEALETALAQAAADMVASGSAWLPVEQVKKRLGASKLPGAFDVLRQAGILTLLTRSDPAAGQGTAQIVSFGRPLLQVYFTALAWAGLSEMSADPQRLLSDPLLAETLVFLINLESDSGRVAALLSALLDQPGAAPRLLAARCLLAMPAAARSPELVRMVCARLIPGLGQDELSDRSTWELLETLAPARRAALYAETLAPADALRQDAALRAIASLSGVAERPGGDLADLLQVSDEAFALSAVKVWGSLNPDATLSAVCDLYESGPQEKRRLALRLLGTVPHDGAVEYLARAFDAETDPAARIEILRALMDQEVKDLDSLLLDVLLDAREAAEVRVFAAQTLAFRGLPDPDAGADEFRRLVLAGRTPLPGQAAQYVGNMLQDLRRRYPDQVAAWEGLLNPYSAGRPVASSAMFFGRAQLMRDLRALIENGGHALIYGEKKIGKSSILQQLHRDVLELVRQGLPRGVALVDIAGFEEREFYYALMERILALLDDAELPAQPAQTLPYTDLAFERDLGLVTARMQKKGSSARLVVLLDGADCLLEYSQAKLASLRRILGGPLGQSVVMVIAAARSFSAESPLAPVMSAYRVPRFTPAEAAELVTRPVAGSLNYDRDALEQIIQAAQGRPAAIQAICQRLVSAAQARGATQVSLALVNEVLSSGTPPELALGESPRAALVDQSAALVNSLMDWLDAHPGMEPAQVEELVRRASARFRDIMLARLARGSQGGRSS